MLICNDVTMIVRAGRKTTPYNSGKAEMRMYACKHVCVCVCVDPSENTWKEEYMTLTEIAKALDFLSI